MYGPGDSVDRFSRKSLLGPVTAEDGASSDKALVDNVTVVVGRAEPVTVVVTEIVVGPPAIV
jgi:hypothetical protein